jgi:DNA-directed RNA polymerase subunit RPC12/RpoP
MELRCKNCHAHLSVPSVGALKEVQCPKCGVMMLLPRQRPAAVEDEEDDAELHRKHQHALQRVFDPIPKPVLYTLGAILGLVLLSPFWIALISNPIERTHLDLDDELAPSAGATNQARTAPAAPVFGTNQAVRVDLSQYAGIRLDTRREDLEFRFNLTLQNTRGMQPEVYVAYPAAEIQRLTAHFYNGMLREITLVMRERLASVDATQAQLVELYGQPREQKELSGENSGGALGGVGVPSDPLTKKLASFSQRRLVVWADDQYRVEATIYYTNHDLPQPVSLLQIRLSSVAWLATARPVVGATVPVPVPAPEPERPVTPLLPSERRLSP